MCYLCRIMRRGVRFEKGFLEKGYKILVVREEGFDKCKNSRGSKKLICLICMS